MSRSTRPAMRRVASGAADSVTPILVLAVLALLGVRGFFQQQQGSPAALVWTDVGVRAAMFLAITAPLVLLGIFATSKIFNFKLSGGTYMRAAAIGAIPIVAMLGASLLPPNPVVRMLLIVGSIPVAVLLARGLFDLNPVEMLALAGICAPLFLIGMGVTSKVSTMAYSAGGGDATLAENTSAGGGTGPGAPAAGPGPARAGPANPNQARLDALASRVEATSGAALNAMSREQFNERLASLQSDLEALKATSGETAVWQRLSGQIRDLAAYGANLPSEKPDESIFQPMTTGQNWFSVALNSQGNEVTFDALSIRMPGNAKLDLRASDPAAPTLTWSWPNTWSTLSIKLVPAPDDRQRRPWVVTRAVMQRFAPVPALFIIESDQTAMSAGNLADTVFFRVERPGAGAGVVYAGRIDGKWLMATITAAAGSEARNAFEAAVKTLRRRAATEPLSDPFAPAMLVTRLDDEPDTAAALLRRQGPAAEPALLAALEGSSAPVRIRILGVLADVATEKSLDALRPLADSSDSATAQAAITVLRRLAPLDYDDLALAALSLRRGSDPEKQAALQKLAAATKDPARPQITREIEEVVLLERPALQPDAIKALAVWADSQTTPRLIPWLQQNAPIQRRRAAMAILPSTHDPAAVVPILNWIIQMPDDVTRAIIAMGPVAEDEVIKHLFTNLDNNRNTVARTAGTRILGEIGTSKSLPVLTRASNDPRDAGAAAVAKAELEKLRARVLLNRGGATGRGA